MKKLIVIVLIIIILSTMLLVAQAASKNYKLDELHMSIDIPDDCIVFTQNIDQNDPNLEKLGVKADELMAQYKANNIFLNCIFLDPLNEIVITKMIYDGSKEIYNFSKMSDTMLEAVAKVIMSSEDAKNMGITYTSHKLDLINDNNYIVLDMWQYNENNKVYSRQYYTIVNGQAINITLHSYTGALTDEMMQKQRSIISSVKYENIPNPNDTAAEKSDTGAEAAVKTIPPTENYKINKNESLTGSTLIDKFLIGGVTGAILAIAAIIIGVKRAKEKRLKKKPDIELTPSAETVNNNLIVSDKSENTQNFNESFDKLYIEKTEVYMKKLHEETENNIEKPANENPESKSSDMIFCRKCGTRIPADSDFCFKCGNKIIRL